MLDKEFKYYLDNQNELLKKYNGRFIVIVGEDVVGDYDTFDDAYFKSVEKYKLGTFLIQKCTEGDKDYTQTFHSRVKFA
jgi:calcineurin-like phosphoesterase family protein